MAGTVKRDNIPYDFYSLEISLSSGGEPIAFVSIEEIEYTITINREKMYGSSRLPVARTDGEVEFEGSMTVNRGQYHTIVAQAREVGVPLANLEFNLTIVYGKRDEIHVDVLERVMFQEFSNSHSRGPDPLQVTLGLDIMNIFTDGVDALGNTFAA
jgi:hypothetical protein